MSIIATKARNTLDEPKEKEIAAYIAANPTAKFADTAKKFGVSSSTISRINGDYDLDAKGNVVRNKPFGRASSNENNSG